MRVPKNASLSQIRAFVGEREEWIKKNVEIIRSRMSVPPLLCDDTEILPLLGKEYVIRLYKGRNVYADEKYLYIPDDEKRKEKLLAYIKKTACGVYEQRIGLYENLIGVKCSSVKLSSAKGRWGSCSAKNSINLSYRLIMFPMCIIDYIIIHELCHIVHKNHSKRFWTLVGKFDPEYALHISWLKQNSFMTDLI